jgi:hypothetical protein
MERMHGVIPDHFGGFDQAVIEQPPGADSQADSSPERAKFRAFHRPEMNSALGLNAWLGSISAQMQVQTVVANPCGNQKTPAPLK